MEPDKGNQPNNRDLKSFHGEAAASSVETAGAAYQAPSMVASGASAQEVALLVTLTNLIFSLILVKIPSILDSRVALKRIVLIFSFLNIITWIPLIIVLFFLGKISPAWLIVLWFISIVPTQLTGPLRDNWLAERIPAKRMGQYLSLRSAVSGFVYLGAFYLMGYMLSSSGGQIFKGYAAVLFISLAGAIACFVLFKRIRPPDSEQYSPSGQSFGFLSFLKVARTGQLGKFILYASALSFSVYLCSALFTVYMLRDLHFGYMAYTVVISSEFLARIVSLIFWGRLVDRQGSMKVMKIASVFIPFVPVLWLFSSNVVYLVLVQLLSGTVWAAFDLSNQTYVYREAPHEKRLRYIVYQKSLTTFAMSMGALAGALILPVMFPVFGNQILGLFLLSGVLRLLIVAFMYPKKNNSANETTVGASQAESVKNGKVPVYVSPRLGLYYHPERWVEKPAAPRFITVTPSTDTLITKGAYYRQESWDSYIRSSEQLSERTAKKLTLEKTYPPYRGLYYHPKKWQEYVSERPVRQTAVCLSEAEKLMQQPLHVVRPQKLTKLPERALRINSTSRPNRLITIAS